MSSCNTPGAPVYYREKPRSGESGRSFLVGMMPVENMYEVIPGIDLKIPRLNIIFSQTISIADSLWLPEPKIKAAFTCEQRDEVEKKGLHFFNLQQEETYRWLKRVGGKELKKCLVDRKNPPVLNV